MFDTNSGMKNTLPLAAFCDKKIEALKTSAALTPPVTFCQVKYYATIRCRSPRRRSRVRGWPRLFCSAPLIVKRDIAPCRLTTKLLFLLKLK